MHHSPYHIFCFIFFTMFYLSPFPHCVFSPLLALPPPARVVDFILGKRLRQVSAFVRLWQRTCVWILTNGTLVHKKIYVWDPKWLHSQTLYRDITAFFFPHFVQKFECETVIVYVCPAINIWRGQAVPQLWPLFKKNFVDKRDSLIRSLSVCVQMTTNEFCGRTKTTQTRRTFIFL